MQKKIYTANPNSFSYIGKLEFEDAYGLLTERKINANFTELVDKVCQGTRVLSERVCALCEKKHPFVTFKKDAHSIPACVGNKIYFTNDECDNCNELAGNEWEDHLAKMTLAERSLFGIPTRNGLPKWNYTGKENQIIRKPGEALVINTGGLDDAIKFTLNREDKKIVLEGPAHKYKPVNAIKAIIHSALLIMDEEQRNKYGSILRNVLLNNAQVSSKFVFYQLFISDFPSQLVQLSVYQKQVSEAGLPDLVVSLNIGSLQLLWSSPLVETGVYAPFPHRPIVCDADAPPPQMTVYTISDLQQEFDPRNSTIELVFKEIQEIDFQTQPPRNDKFAEIRKPKKGFVKLRNEFLKQDLTFLDVFTSLRNIGASHQRIVISGEDLPVKLKLESEDFSKQKSTISMSFEFELKNKQLSRVLKILEFLELISDENSLIEVYWEGQTAPAFTLGGPRPNNEFTYARTAELVKKLLDLAEFLNVNFLYPERISKEEGELIHHLHDIYIRGYSNSTHGKFRFVFGAEASIEDVDAIRMSLAEVLLRNPMRQVELIGTKLSLPEFVGKVETYKVSEEEFEVGKELPVAALIEFRGIKFTLSNQDGSNTNS